MGYMHIENLYRNQDILMFKEAFSLEKIHGTSAHVGFKLNREYLTDGNKESGTLNIKPKVTFFSGGAKHENFKELFDEEILKNKFIETGLDEVVLFGEAYGGKLQGMRNTYGDTLKFVAFDVKIGHVWLSVPKAEKLVNNMGLEFVAYEKINTDLESIDKERDRPSRQAKRNGIGEDRIQEGVVLRPIIEVRKNNGARIICKHKRDEFIETTKPRKVQDTSKLKAIAEAKEVADDWVTNMRLNHVLDKIKDHDITKLGIVINAMLGDIKREGEGEIVWSKSVEKQIGKETARLYKQIYCTLYKGKE